MCGRLLFSSLFPHGTDRILLAVCAGSAFFCPPAADVARGQVLINEIYYDHPGTDEGFEFVELMNVSESPASLREYSIEFHNGAGEGWTPVWSGGAGDSIAASGLFLIGEPRVDPHPDSIVQLNLQNGPDAVRLLKGGVQVDVLGYGPLDDPLYYEAGCAPDVPAGSSLGRIPDGRDTDDNLADFKQLKPSPGRLNLPLRDLSIHSDPGFERVVEPGEVSAISFIVRNDGIRNVEANEFALEVRDSSALSVELIAGIGGAAIAPGESWRFECPAALQYGYHWITASIRHPGDERPWNDSLTTVVRAGNPGVVISEVMSYPGDDCPQYIELYNCAGEPADPAGWRIRDCSHEPQAIADSARVLPSHAYAVVTHDAEGLAAAFVRLDPERVIEIEGTWPSLNHTGTASFADSIVITDRFGLAVDRAAYPPQESRTKGTSIERADLYPGERMHTWILSSSPEGGTPGGENSVFMERPPSGPGMTLSPNPFELGTEALLIEIPFLPRVERVVVAVYDIHGSVVREAGTACGLPAVFVWDGKRADGTDVDSGIYVVACEEFFAGNERRVERAVVGCGKSGSKKR